MRIEKVPAIKQHDPGKITRIIFRRSTHLAIVDGDAAIEPRFSIVASLTNSIMFASTFSLPTLIIWCRNLRHGLDSGLTLVRVMRLLATKGPTEGRSIATEIGERLEHGDSFEEAMEPNLHRFPQLFSQMAIIGERSGRMPIVFGQLEEYFEQQHSLWREFKSQIRLPLFQLVGGILVVAALIWILGMIAEGRGGTPIAPIGFGLTGAKGAIAFLVVIAMFFATLFMVYRIFTRGLRQRAALESFLLRMPSIGPCLEAIALGRFCLGMQLTTDSSMPMDECVRESLRATANAAFMAEEGLLAGMVKSGKELGEAIRRSKVFPSEFADILEVAEVSGQIPESMARQAAHYREEASRRMKNLSRMTGYAVYFFIAGCLVWAIFKIGSIYVGAINDAAG